MSIKKMREALLAWATDLEEGQQVWIPASSLRAIEQALAEQANPEQSPAQSPAQEKAEVTQQGYFNVNPRPTYAKPPAPPAPLTARRSAEPAEAVRKLIEKVDRLVEMDDAPPMSLGDWIDAWNEIKVAMGAVKVWQACCEHRDAQASAINEKMLETLHKVLVAGRGSSGRIILEEEHEDLINAAIAAAEAHKGAA